MTADELRREVFEALEQRFRRQGEAAASGGAPFVARQDDKVVVVAAGELFAVLVVPTRVEVG